MFLCRLSYVATKIALHKNELDTQNLTQWLGRVCKRLSRSMSQIWHMLALLRAQFLKGHSPNAVSPIDLKVDAQVQVKVLHNKGAGYI